MWYSRHRTEIRTQTDASNQITWFNDDCRRKNPFAHGGGNIPHLHSRPNLIDLQTKTTISCFKKSLSLSGQKWIKNRIGNIVIVLLGRRRIFAVLWSIITFYKMIHSNLQLQNQSLKESLVEGVERVHPGSDCTSRSVARNQVPRHKPGF